jgi:hypothetical protein
MEENDSLLQAPRSKRNTLKLDLGHFRAKSVVQSDFLTEEVVLKMIDTTIEPLRKHVKALEYDLKDILQALDLKAGPIEIQNIERRFELY